MRRKQAEAAAAEQPGSSAGPAAKPAPARTRASQTWATCLPTGRCSPACPAYRQAGDRQVKRVYEIDPLVCAKCGGTMKVVAFIEPPQADVIEKILRHYGLCCPAAPRAPPGGDLRVYDPDSDGDGDSTSREPRELTFVDEATFWSTF